MIPVRDAIGKLDNGKPRASGDDPTSQYNPVSLGT